MGNASIWDPNKEFIPEMYGANSIMYEKFTATAGQQTFDITMFTYTLGTNSVLVFHNGELQVIVTDFTEVTSSRIYLNNPCTAGDKVAVIGLVQIDSTLTTPAPGTVSIGSLQAGFILPISRGGTGVTSLAALVTAIDCLVKSGGTMTGALTLYGNASTALHAVPLQQVQALIAASVPSETIYDFNSRQNIAGSSFFF